nr:hypothetical protein [uncultured Acidocella sp.]
MSASLSQMVFDHIRTEYAVRRHAVEVLARAAGVSPNTSRNWLRGFCAPQADTLGELAQNDAAFKAKLIAWLEDRS